MRQWEHTFRQRSGFVLLSLLALAFFFSWPYLLIDHHHSDVGAMAHCPLCLLASGHVVPASAPFDGALLFSPIGELRTADDILRPGLPIDTANERAPPAA